jgi:hypothetical protein
MLQPLWESRDRYEELKQLDDAMKEVKAAPVHRPVTPGLRSEVGGSQVQGPTGLHSKTASKE